MDQIETLKSVIRWLCIVLVVVCILWGATNAYWLWSWMQYDYVTETYTYEQDGEGINIIGDRNGVYSDGTESNRNEEIPDEAGEQGYENPEILKEELP